MSFCYQPGHENGCGHSVTVHTLVRGIGEIMPLSMFLPFRRIVVATRVIAGQRNVL